MTRPSYSPLDIWDWDHLPLSAHGVLRCWWTMLSGDSPWRDMHPDDQLGKMRNLVDELLNEARDPDDGTRLLRLANSARAHGSFRHAQRCSECDLLRETDALRSAIAFQLLETGWSPQLVAQSLIVLDLDLRRARDGMQHGWRRTSVQAEGVAG